MNQNMLHFAFLFLVTGLVMSVWTSLCVVLSDLNRPAKHESIALWAGVAMADFAVSGILFVAAHLSGSLQWVS